MLIPPQSPESLRNRNRTYNRKNSAKIEQYLMTIEKVHGFARSWELRERLERGDIRLSQVSRF